MRLLSQDPPEDLPRRVPLKLQPGPGETLDAICGGGVRVLQRRQGYRFTLDPLLLAHFAMDEGAAQRGRLMDLGTGCGIIPLVLARRLGRKDITALELQPHLFSLAERNVYLNRCEREVSLVHGDLRRVGMQFAAGSFAHVLCNLPDRTRASGRSSVSMEKAIARHELACDLQDVVRAADHLLVPRGTLFMVYPASCCGELTSVLRVHRMEPGGAGRGPHPQQGLYPAYTCQESVGGARFLNPLVRHRLSKCNDAKACVVSRNELGQQTACPAQNLRQRPRRIEGYSDLAHEVALT